MKKWIHSATQHDYGTIIRMVDPQKTAGRGFGKDELFKVYHETEDPHEALALAYSLRNEQLDPSDIDPNEDITTIIDPAVINLSNDAIEQDFNNTDLGSGELIVFSVRVNGKLVYRSGLNEKEWGSMPSDFVNTVNHDYEDYRKEYDALFQEFLESVEPLKRDPQITIEGGWLLTVTRTIPIANDNRVCTIQIASAVNDPSDSDIKLELEKLKEELNKLDQCAEGALNFPDILYVLDKKDVPNGSSVRCYYHYADSQVVHAFCHHSEEIVARKSDRRMTSGNIFLVSEEVYNSFT